MANYTAGLTAVLTAETFVTKITRPDQLGTLSGPIGTYNGTQTQFNGM